MATHPPDETNTRLLHDTAEMITAPLAMETTATNHPATESENGIEIETETETVAVKETVVKNDIARKILPLLPIIEVRIARAAVPVAITPLPVMADIHQVGQTTNPRDEWTIPEAAAELKLETDIPAHEIKRLAMTAEGEAQIDLMGQEEVDSVVEGTATATEREVLLRNDLVDRHRI